MACVVASLKAHYALCLVGEPIDNFAFAFIAPLCAYDNYIFSRDIDPFAFYPNLGVENDASHAFYLGVELARAQIAHQLKKRYVQDEELNWGVASEGRVHKTDGRKSHREASLKEKTSKKE